MWKKKEKIKEEKRIISLKEFTSKAKVEDDEDIIDEDSLKEGEMGLFVNATKNT